MAAYTASKFKFSGILDSEWVSIQHFKVWHFVYILFANHHMFIFHKALRSLFSGAARNSSSSQPSLHSLTYTIYCYCVWIHLEFISAHVALTTSVNDSCMNLRAHTSEGVPLDVRDEPPGPRPASHNVRLLIRSTAATFRNNTLPTHTSDMRNYNNTLTSTQQMQ